MRAAIAASAVTLGLLASGLASGCGSSSSAGTAASSAPATSAKTTTVGSGKSSLKVATTPKFASPSPSAPVQSGLVRIAYRNITISPDTVRVKAGSTVMWTNYDEVQHNVTSIGGHEHVASGDFGGGSHFKVKLTRPGILHYECTIHPTSMNGTIEVL
jgi:plastocyanin